jgi:hypothetical protein
MKTVISSDVAVSLEAVQAVNPPVAAIVIATKKATIPTFLRTERGPFSFIFFSLVAHRVVRIAVPS